MRGTTSCGTNVELGYGELMTSTAKARRVDVQPIQSTVNHSNICTGISTQRCLCHLHMPSTASRSRSAVPPAMAGSLVRLSSGVPAWHRPLHLNDTNGLMNALLWLHFQLPRAHLAF